MPRIETLADLEAAATELASRLAPKSQGATLVTLSGELGAGKTAFVQALAKALGVSEDVTSPTFVLAKTYPLVGQRFATLTHCDAYRLEEGEGVTSFGLEEQLTDPAALIVLEWPERIHKALPIPDVAITLVVQEDGSRTLTYG